MSNVLVYSGPGVSASSLSHTLNTLRRLLPTYDVQCINAQSLAVDPWMETTSLLVLPGGRDLPYVDKLGEAHASSSSSGPARHGSSSRMARADARIREYVVERGGAFLGICAGAYYASGTCDFERGDAVMEVIGDRPALRFFPGTCRGTVYPGFVYESDDGARLVSLSLADAPEGQPWSTYYNGGGAFLDAHAFSNAGIEVLASYMTDEQAQQRGAAAANSAHSIRRSYAGQAAAVLCHTGHGRALLYGTHPEFPVTTTASPARQSGAPEAMQGIETSFDQLEKMRFEIFGQHLQKLGLRVDLPSTAEAEQAMKLTPLILASRDPQRLGTIVQDLQTGASRGSEAVSEDDVWPGKLFSIADSNDTVEFHDVAVCAQLFAACAAADYSKYLAPVSTPNNVDASRAGNAAEPEMEVDLHRVPKHVIVAGDGSSVLDNTPHWHTPAYFNAADVSRALLAAKQDKEEWAQPPRNASMFAIGNGEEVLERIADVITYAQVVTSTQTMLDKNYKLLTRLPSGLTSFATHQVSGRGRGKNAWISPLGCLQFSTLLRLPSPQQTLWHAGMSSIVFVQYLAGLAIVESVRAGALGDEYAKALGNKIRIKWPNDVYAEVEDAHEGIAQSDGTRKGTFAWRGKRYAKMAGVLVNSQFAGTELALVVGCGINTLNARPTTSLSDLIEAHNAADPASPSLAIVSQERFAGAILATFERMWSTFVQAGGNFAPFVEAYRRAWLHSDQETLLTDTEPSTRARIVGITTDHGMLRCVPLPPPGDATTQKGVPPGLPDTYSHGAWGTSADSAKSPVPFIDLQPDGNSFDMLQNLIRRKD